MISAGSAAGRTSCGVGPRQNILPFVRDGRDNGAWFHRGHVVWQNEDTVARESLHATAFVSRHHRL